METPNTPDQPSQDEPSGPSTPPPRPEGPQAPAGPQAPRQPAPDPRAPAYQPPDPRAPAWQPPAGPDAPAWQPPPPPPGPYAPPGPGGPSYGGPVPPGGWHQPIPPHHPGWQGSPLASWGTRAAAWLIDLLILAVPVVVLTLVVVAGAASNESAVWASVGLTFLVYLVVAVLYAPLLMMRDGEHNGQTWGKQALGIRVVRNTGQPMGFGWSALREIVVKSFLFGWLGSWLFGLPLILDYLWPLWDDENRALHDMIVSTHVVQA